jgi:hypothetical protein
MTETRTDLCKEYLKYEVVIHYLQNVYDQFLEYKSLTNFEVIEMNAGEIEIFWNEYDIYAFGIFSYIGYTNISSENSKLNAQINIDYNKGIDICEDNYVYNYELLMCIYLYFWGHANDNQRQYIQKILIEPRLELK